MSLHFSLESRFLGEIASCTDFMFQTEDTLWVSKCGAVVECRKVNLKTQVRLQAVLLLRVWGNVFILKKFYPCKIMSEKFDIYNKIFFRDVEIFSTPVWIGPAGVELLRQLFLQCKLSFLEWKLSVGTLINGSTEDDLFNRQRDMCPTLPTTLYLH